MAVRRTSAPLDSASLYAEYPFLPGAESLLGGEEFSIRSLLEDPAFEEARALGRARILAAADDPRASQELRELSVASSTVRYLSFLFARIVLAAAPAAAPLRRWAVAEAKRSYGRLADVPADELIEVARHLEFHFEARPEGVAVPLVEYVRLSVPIREAPFRLAQQAVHRGEVDVRAVRAARLVQEAVRLQLAVPLPLATDVVGLIREREAALFADLEKRTPTPVARAGAAGVLRRELFPPCIRKMMRTLEKGENLSHSGRFGLAAFLHRAGADVETIVDAYRGAPDFDESITRYQVDHITLRDGGRGYEPPECDTLRSHGLCVRDGDPTASLEVDRRRDERCFDPTLRHPLQYYRRRGGVVADRDDDGAPTPPPGGRGTPGGPARRPSNSRRG